MMIDLNKLATEVHLANKKWWVSLEDGTPLKRNRGELLMLVITEVAEACEGLRKNLNDDKVPHRLMVEVEMADCFIRLLDFSAGFGEQLFEVHNVELPDNQPHAMLEICAIICRIPTDGRACGMGLSVAIGAVRSFCFKFGYDLMEAYSLKMAYNSTREDHSNAARKMANGKRF